MSLPTITNATVQLNRWGNVEIIMDNGYVYYDRDNYLDLTDDEGNSREPLPEEISYFRYGVYPRSISNEEIERRIVVVAESDVPADQIFGVGDDNHEII